MKHNKKGFTLIELMVSISIFTVITTIAIFSNASFNASVLLTNLAYEIALSVRQAQVYGTLVKQSSTYTFDSGYGVHFDMASPTTYTLFEDKAPLNHSYDAGELLQTFTIQKGNKISKVCVDNSCTNGTTFTIVDVSFTRPNPDAYIRKGSDLTNYGKAEICLLSPQNLKRKIVVESTGQISVSIVSSSSDNCY